MRLSSCYFTVQVILLKNLETGVGLVNGARGVVVRFSAPDDPAAAEHQRLAKFINPPNQWPIVRFACDGIERLVGPESWSVLEGDKEIAKRSQVSITSWKHFWTSNCNLLPISFRSCLLLPLMIRIRSIFYIPIRSAIL
jgi:hypothetical protein